MPLSAQSSSTALNEGGATVKGGDLLSGLGRRPKTRPFFLGLVIRWVSYSSHYYPLERGKVELWDYTTSNIGTPQFPLYQELGRVFK